MIRSFLHKAQLIKASGCAAISEPNQVGGLTATGGSGQISLSWTADSTPAPNAATSYVVERSIDGLGSWSTIATNVTTNSYVDSGLGSSVTRHYRVSSVNCFGQQIPSASANATTAAVSTPTAPSGFTATSSFADSVSLAWTDNSSGSGQETGFEIEVSTNGGTSYSSVTTTAADATSYSHTGRVESQAYLYRIRATNSAGSSSWVTASSVTTPAALTGFTATASSSSAISLSWTDKSGVETGFRIERSTDNVSFSLVTTTAANAVSHSDSGLAASTLYYYRIRSNSYNGTNDSAWYSASATTQSGSSNYSIEYLTVGGGGAGGSYGGGGAGGYRTATGFSLTPGTSYTITVGAGGAAGTTGGTGNDSVFSTVTAKGGGGGGAANGNGTNGGSGGGGGVSFGSGGNGGSGTAGEGTAGGNGQNADPYGGGGGGGADAAGAVATTTSGGNGGAGKAFYGTNYSGGGGGGSWRTTTLSGGVGGTGGTGGGGDGQGKNTPPSMTAGTANRGGGGGGFGNGGQNGAAGGSGIVILRVPAANYSGTTTGSPTVTDDGSTKVLTFTASGSYTA